MEERHEPGDGPGREDGRRQVRPEWHGAGARLSRRSRIGFSLPVPTLEETRAQLRILPTANRLDHLLRVPEQELLPARPPSPGREPGTLLGGHASPDRVPPEHPAAVDD